MKLTALVLSMVLCTPMAFAQNETTLNSDDQVWDLEQGPMRDEDAAELMTPAASPDANGEDFARDVIGIIGAIAADRIDRHRPGRPGRRHPPRDDWRRRDEFICYARDGRGRLYRAVGFNPRRVQDRAVDNCYRNARFCRALGCERL